MLIPMSAIFWFGLLLGDDDRVTRFPPEVLEPLEAPGATPGLGQLFAVKLLPEVSSMAVSPDGKSIAASGKQIVIWSIGAVEPIRKFAAVSDNQWFRNLSSVAYSPDGKTLVVGCWDGSITVWDLPEAKLRHKLVAHKEGDDSEWSHPVWKVAVSPDGKSFASASWDATARVWDLSTGQVRHVLKHPAKVRNLAYSPDGKTLATAMSFEPGRSVILWDAETGKQGRTIRGDRTGTVCLAFSPDGKTLATGGQDRLVQLWDFATGVRLGTVGQHTEEVSALAFSRDGKWLASAASYYRIPNSGETLISEVATGRPYLRIAGSLPVNNLAFNSDGRGLVTSGAGGAVRVWDFQPGAFGSALQSRVSTSTGAIRADEPARCVAVSPEGRTLAAASGRLVTLYDLPARTERARLQGHDAVVVDLKFSKDGRTLVSSGTEARLVGWDVTTGKKLHSFDRPYVTTFSIAFTPRGEEVVASFRDNFTKGWNPRTGEIRNLFLVYRIGSIAYSPDGRLLATSHDGERDATVYFHGTDVESGKVPGTLTDPESNAREVVPPVKLPIPAATGVREVTAIAFTPDGKTLAIGERNHDGGSHDLLLCTFPEGGVSRRIGTLQAPARALAVSPEGRFLAVAGSAPADGYGELHLIDLRDPNSSPIPLTGHDGPVHGVAFSADGKELISSGEDGVIRFWKVPR